MILNIQPLDPLTPSRGPIDLGFNLSSSGGSNEFTEDGNSSQAIPFRGEYKQKEVVFEKPWMRTAAYMLVGGAKVPSVAEECQVSESQVWTLSRQGWFRQLMANIAREQFSDNNLTALLQTAAMESLMTIRDLATNAPSDSVRLKAAQDLLDRHRGKATNFVQHMHGKSSEDPKEEILRLKAEIKEEEKHNNPTNTES